MYKNILRDTFASVFEEKDALFKALIIPTLLLMFFNYFGAFDVNNLYLSIPIIVLTIIINITISITTHRILLLKENSIPTWGLFKLSSREGKFFLSTFALGLIIILVGVLTMAGVMLFEALFTNFLNPTINAIIIVFILFAILSVMSRLSIVFPAISVDKNITFTDSWNYTKDYKLLCFITIIVFPALFAIALSLPYGFIIDILADKISSHMTAFYSILNVFINIFIISALSNTYLYIISNLPEEEITQTTYTVTINDNEAITLNADSNINFDVLKYQLTEQYSKLEYHTASVDKEDSWILKNDDIKNSYISLEFKNNDYYIETFNVEDPRLKILEKDDTIIS